MGLSSACELDGVYKDSNSQMILILNDLGENARWYRMVEHPY
jgi:hypothetical protein